MRPWKSYWQVPGLWRLIFAVAVSLVLHWIFIGEFSIDLPTPEHPSQALEAQLVLPNTKVHMPSNPAKVKAPVKPQAKPIPKPEKSKPVEPTQVAANPIVPAKAQPAVIAEPAPTRNWEAPLEAAESETPIEDAGLMINPDAYKYVETTFDVRTDPLAKVDSRPDGRAKIIYRLLPNGEQYKLDSLIQPNGLAAFVIPDLLQTSEGFMSGMGLQPTQYLYQFGDKKDKTYRARMDWESAKLHLQTSKATKEVPLVPGTQDLLSFMYQFMFIPPPQNMQLNITNGKKLDIYQYFFAGEETIPTKMGGLRTMHIYRDNDDGDERSELWLALDYQYVPVKIRKTEPENKVYELLATSIKTEMSPESQP